MFIDSHCHLSYEPLIKDIDRVLSVCEKHKVEKLLTIGTDYKSSKICSDLSMKYKNIYYCLNIFLKFIFSCWHYYISGT